MNTRFINNGDGTVTDLTTGLTWMENAHVSRRLTWDSANEFVERLSIGHRRWHIPSLREFLTLIDYDHASPALPSGHPFLIAKNFYYWSSTGYVENPRQAWAINLFGGSVNIFCKEFTFAVWPVSDTPSSEELPDPPF